MSNFVGTLLSICIIFFLVFLKFLLILILYKLINSYIFQQSSMAFPSSTNSRKKQVVSYWQNEMVAN